MDEPGLPTTNFFEKINDSRRGSKCGEIVKMTNFEHGETATLIGCCIAGGGHFQGREDSGIA
jgi:hypothetical protein